MSLKSWIIQLTIFLSIGLILLYTKGIEWACRGPKKKGQETHRFMWNGLTGGFGFKCVKLSHQHKFEVLYIALIWKTYGLATLRALSLTLRWAWDCTTRSWLNMENSLSHIIWTWRFSNLVNIWNTHINICCPIARPFLPQSGRQVLNNQPPKWKNYRKKRE